MFKKNTKPLWQMCLIMALLFLVLKGPAFAVPDFFLYGNQDTSDTAEFDVIEVKGYSYFTAMDYFKSGANEGKILAATGTSIYIQAAVGSSTWIKVAEVEDYMDPAFVRLSPSGDKVALGLGWGQDILVFNASLLDEGTPEAPVNLTYSDQTLAFMENHYDAAWIDEDNIVINGGKFVVAGQSAVSGVAVLNITDENNMSQGVCTSIPGASSGIAVDADQNLIFGIGAGTNTGELKIWPRDTWWNGSTSVGVLEYNGSEGQTFANQVMSAAYLGFDGEGNLHVGGGEFLNPEPVNLESGYAALINQKVMTDAVNPAIPLYQVDEANEAQYREFGPDVCRNDTATGVMAYGSNLSVNWNPATAPGSANCIIGGNIDWWSPGVTSKITNYSVNNNRDGDNDGVYDVADNSPNTYDTANTDTDGDGYGNMIDGDFNNDGIVNGADFLEFKSHYGSQNPETDMNNDGIVNGKDFLNFKKLYGKSEPFYNF